MKITNILYEQISDIVYHYTDIKHAASILANDKFNLTATFSTGVDYALGDSKLFFLSTTRAKTGGYTKAYNGGVVLELDGRKLSNNYKGKAVDYWGRDFRKISTKYNEFEDRIFSSKPQIPNATRYIKSMHVYFEDIRDNNRSYLLELKKSNIPVYLYDDANAFKMQNTRKSKPLSEFDIKSDRVSNIPYDKNATNKQQRRIGRKRQIYGLEAWSILLSTPVEQFNSLPPDVRNMLSTVIRRWNNDVLDELKADLQSHRADNYFMNRLAPIMNKNGLKNAEDIVQFVEDKWKATYNEDGNSY